MQTARAVIGTNIAARYVRDLSHNIMHFFVHTPERSVVKMMKIISSNPYAIATSNEGNGSLYQLHKLYDGSGQYEAYRVSPDGVLHRIKRGGVRFEGTFEAVLKLFDLWVLENVLGGEVHTFNVNINRGEDKRATKLRIAHGNDSRRRRGDGSSKGKRRKNRSS